MNPQLAGNFASKLSGFSPATQQMLGLLSPEEQQKILPDLVKEQIRSDQDRSALELLSKPTYSLEEMEGFREREARRAQQLGKESLWEAGKAAALFKNIPQSISNAFGASAAMQLAAAERIPGTYAEVFGVIPRPQIQGSAVPYVQRQYYR